MDQVSIKDFYEIRLASIITSEDIRVLTTLYQPIIGHVSLALYLSFFMQHKNKANQLLNHEHLFKIMDININSFNIAKKRLEACGLIRTFKNNGKDFSVYTYELYAPLSPYEFFDDPLFKGMLIKTLGHGEAKRLNSLFSLDEQAEGEEVSASFVDVYRPDFNIEAFNTHLDNFASSRKVYAVTQSFDEDLFKQALLANGHLELSALSKDEIHTIGQLATLYGLSEETVATNVLSSYNPTGRKGNRVDFNKLRRFLGEEVKYSFTGIKSDSRSKYIRSEAESAKMINMMEATPPIDFLSLIQEGRVVAPADRRLIEDLSLQYGLNNGSINALIFGVLNLTEGKLPYNYVTKIASTIGRNKLDNALDVTNFLRDTARSISKSNKKRSAKAKETATVQTIKETTVEEVDAKESAVTDEEIQKLIMELENL